MTAAELLALAERVEGLSGPCRETDGLVALALGYERYEAFISGVDRAGPWWDMEIRWRSPAGFNNQNLPSYTASIDAAMTLVPEGHVMSLNSTSDDEKRRYTGSVPIADWVAMLIKQEHCGYKIDFRGHCRHGYAATPALALTAAALRARAANMGDDNE